VKKKRKKDPRIEAIKKRQQSLQVDDEDSDEPALKIRKTTVKDGKKHSTLHIYTTEQLAAVKKFLKNMMVDRNAVVPCRLSSDWEPDERVYGWVSEQNRVTLITYH
jgi:hypothetical protein